MGMPMKEDAETLEEHQQKRGAEEHAEKPR
jgi:hypothetical protein